jgi:hypothetical protein
MKFKMSYVYIGVAFLLAVKILGVKPKVEKVTV